MINIVILFLITNKMEDKNKEQVEHPNHYNKGIEMWDYAHSHDLDFFEGNVVKYVTRWRHKNGLQDLEKALMYLSKLIELEKIK